MYETPSEEAKNAAENLSCALNCMGGSANSAHIVRSMLNLHRTLNQAFTGNIVLPFVREMARNFREGNYDPRNEAACKVCDLMWNAICKEHGFAPDAEPRLPLI